MELLHSLLEGISNYFNSYFNMGYMFSNVQHLQSQIVQLQMAILTGLRQAAADTGSYISDAAQPVFYKLSLIGEIQQKIGQLFGR